MATTIRIPIDIRNPRFFTLAGNSFFTVVSLTNMDLGEWQFVKDVDGKLYGVVTIPSNLAVSPLPAIVLIIGANATSGVTRMNVANKVVAKDGESYDVAFVSDTAQDVTVPATARFHKEITFTVGDLANVAAEKLLYIEILHEGTDVADTLAVNTELIEAYLRVDIQ